MKKKLVAVMKSKRTRIRSVWLRHLKSPITSRKGKNRLNKKNSQKKGNEKKNLLAAMSLKGPEVSLDAAHRDAGSASTYVV